VLSDWRRCDWRRCDWHRCDFQLCDWLVLPRVALPVDLLEIARPHVDGVAIRHLDLVTARVLHPPADLATHAIQRLALGRLEPEDLHGVARSEIQRTRRRRHRRR